MLIMLIVDLFWRAWLDALIATIPLAVVVALFVYVLWQPSVNAK